MTENGIIILLIFVDFHEIFMLNLKRLSINFNFVVGLYNHVLILSL